MRRLLPHVLAALLAALLLLPATLAHADTGSDVPASAGTVVLAAEGGGEPVGPDPDLDSTNAPTAYEPPFLINAAYGLTALMVGLVIVLGGLYYVLVYRPGKAREH